MGVHDAYARSVDPGSQVNGFPKAYVIGSYDTRITFYSQQVRALALAHALHAEHHIGGLLPV